MILCAVNLILAIYSMCVLYNCIRRYQRVLRGDATIRDLILCSGFRSIKSVLAKYGPFDRGIYVRIPLDQYRRSSWAFWGFVIGFTLVMFYSVCFLVMRYFLGSELDPFWGYMAIGYSIATMGGMFSRILPYLEEIDSAKIALAARQQRRESW